MYPCLFEYFWIDPLFIGKYKGASNERSQIRASFSPDGRHIICGSEDRYIYLWRTAVDSKDSLAATLSVRKDRNAMWERVRGWCW
jgi:WD40 repeat protein